MKWNKRGLIWSGGNEKWEYSHCQVPVVDINFNDRWRIYFSSRSIENQSHINFIDVEPGNPHNIIGKADKPTLSPNKNLGAFDDCGVMPTSIVSYDEKKYLYYIGWTKKVTVPYHNSIGLLILDKNNIDRKPGPVISTDIKDPGFQGTALVIKDDKNWNMWYMSSIGWEKNEPIYHIKLATSIDGINWKKFDEPAIPLKNGEGGISSAALIKKNNKYHMWYSYRGKIDYRENKNNSYNIGYATSLNGILWTRQDKKSGIDRSKKGWDSEMICYPYVIEHNNLLYMFYNGNGFGKTGIGYATMDLSCL